MPATIVILPTWNEAENLPRMVAALLALPLECLRVLVVDDNSPDGTGRLADDLVRQHPDRVSVLHRARREGYGPATMAGFMAALQTDATCVVQMDCDFSHQPRYLPDLIAQADNADVVIGSRYVPGGSVDANWSLARKLLSWWANSVYVRLLLNLPVRDVTGGYRLWRRETLTGLELGQIRSNGYVFSGRDDLHGPQPRLPFRRSPDPLSGPGGGRIQDGGEHRAGGRAQRMAVAPALSQAASWLSAQQPLQGDCALSGPQRHATLPAPASAGNITCPDCGRCCPAQGFCRGMKGMIVQTQSGVEPCLPT